jgi:hypothetical protein
MSRSSTSVDWHRTVWQVVHNVSGERHCLPTYRGRDPHCESSPPRAHRITKAQLLTEPSSSSTCRLLCGLARGEFVVCNQKTGFVGVLNLTDLEIYVSYLQI